MQEKAFTLHNKGMNRDLSISKAGESAAYENHNIRIVARDNDTALSVTNERGNREITLNSELGIQGELIGWNVLDSHIILFTHLEGADNPDFIYRIDYDSATDSFKMMYGTQEGRYLFNGNMNFSLENPIESVVYHETDKIQKIYWVDGKNPLRFMNFMADDGEVNGWDADGSDFESNKAINYTVRASINKDQSGNTRANGVIQYILTYYNLHGQESGYAWMSDMIYLAPANSGGSPDGTNNTRVEITLSNLDATYTNYRVYSLFRTSLNAAPVAYIVDEGKIEGSDVIVVDEAANQVAEDYTRLLYLGSQPVIAGTMTHKDQTLFLGDFTSIGRKGYDKLESEIAKMRGDGWRADSITFAYDDGIDMPNSDELYPYQNQLAYSSSQIKTFKGGEKYRFALVFRLKDGSSTDAFWIGDKINTLYPKMEGGKIKRVIAKCRIPNNLFGTIVDDNGQTLISTVQLMIAEASYADRCVKAQGIINPTVFNVWERYNNRLYAAPSWITRPRNSGFSWKHFEPIHKSTNSTGEIDCNYWETDGAPTPYYILENYDTDAKSYKDDFDGQPKYDYLMTLYYIDAYNSFGQRQNVRMVAIKATLKEHTTTAMNALKTFDFSSSTFNYANRITYAVQEAEQKHNTITISAEETYFWLEILVSPFLNASSPKGDDGRKTAWAACSTWITDVALIADVHVVPYETFSPWCQAAHVPNIVDGYRNPQIPGTYYTGDSSIAGAIDDSGNHGANRWIEVNSVLLSNSYDYAPSYYRKHLMFVDENVVTLNSPELDNNAVSFDNASGCKLRIIGVAKITSSISDYTVDAKPGKYPGENLIKDSFSYSDGKGNPDGLTSWPLWSEYGVLPKPDNQAAGYTFPQDIKNRTSDDYTWGSSQHNYWLHMWNHSGKINGFTDADNHDYSQLNSKVFANLRVAAKTSYNSTSPCEYSIPEGSLRVFNYTSSKYVGVNVGGDKKYYDGIINTSLALPGEHKYPIIFSSGKADTSEIINSDEADLFDNAPILFNYYSSPHAIIALPTVRNESGGYYTQTILPKTSVDPTYTIEERDTTSATKLTGELLPWINNSRPGETYPYYDFGISQDTFTLPAGSGITSENDRYVYIGEIYADNPNAYGGTSENDIERNRFIVAGPQTTVEDVIINGLTLIGDEGDTYFQRWDCLKTKPFKDSVNGVIDITSVMIESHINLDGRYDLQRGITQLASIDTEAFGQINDVYSQPNNFYQRRDLNEDFNLDAYRSTITWTLQKSDSAQIDEWTHITLANTLKLDGDAGICRALRRFQNSIIAFQDKGISEVLFNSRTQLSTTDGVPVEIANSGKVDGKRYITNKFGCINKWSIVEGKTGMYFIDNINKAFCTFTGNGIDSLSDKLGFGVWFKDINDVKPWAPAEFNNEVSFYDREHSDVYLVRKSEDEMPCLVYNENLQAFTSFFDYNAVPMMTNVRDRFVSFRDNRLWLQNEGLYCKFFGEQYNFWVQYRVTPDPFGDKIWTNFDYRADFYHVLDENGAPQIPEEYLVNGDAYGELCDLYKENMTFSCYRIWNEYQTTGDVHLNCKNNMIDPVRKKFRIWRVNIARAMRDMTNKYGLDRIRNPWINLQLGKKGCDCNNQMLVQLHDIVVRYFE